jgi:hypothetical protein
MRKLSATEKFFMKNEKTIFAEILLFDVEITIFSQKLILNQ